MTDQALDHDFTPSRFFLVRTSGLSIEDVSRLHAPRSVQALDELLDMEKHLAASKEAVTTSLGTAVSDTADPAVRRKLLTLRRNVHNLRPPSMESVSFVPDDIAHEVHGWLARHQAYREALSVASVTVREELADARLGLRELVRESPLRQGIQLGAPVLDRELAGFLGTSNNKTPAKRLRGMERSLVNYAFRAAFKTSPFSSFTPVSLGSFADHGAALELPLDSEKLRNHVMVNLAALAPVLDALAASSEVRRVLPVCLTSGRSQDESRLYYVRRQYGYNPDPTAPTSGLLEEVQFSVPRGQILNEIVDVIEANPGITVNDLAQRLHERDPAQRPLDHLIAYVGKLLDLGLVISAHLRVDPRAADPASDLASRLAELSASGATATAGRINQLAANAREYATAPSPRRAELTAAAITEITEAQRELGRKAVDVPRTVFYEDTVSERVATAHLGQWQSTLLPQLENLATVLPAFDPLVTERLLVKEHFLERYGRGGRCTDIAGFAHEFQRRYASKLMAYGKHEVTDGGSSSHIGRELTALREARESLGAHLRSRVGDLPEDTGEVLVDDEVLGRVRAHLTEITPDVLPVAFFLQLANNGGSPVAAINFAYTGLGMPLARFSYPLENATGFPIAQTLRAQADALSPDSTVYAELTGGYDASNLAWHASLTSYEIAGPAETSFRPADERLPVTDLALVHDPDSGELLLVSTRLDSRVVPVYLGSLMPVALPEIQRTLLALSCTVMPNLNFREWVPGRGIAGVRQQPGIRYRDLILQRREWLVSPDELPRPNHERESAEWLLEWRRWWRANGLPPRVFCTVPGPVDRERARVGSKPRYVSPDSTLSMLAFEHEARQATAPIRMAEMAPGPEQAWQAQDGQRYTSELCIEITGVRKGML